MRPCSNSVWLDAMSFYVFCINYNSLTLHNVIVPRPHASGYLLPKRYACIFDTVLDTIYTQWLLCTHMHTHINNNCIEQLCVMSFSLGKCTSRWQSYRPCVWPWQHKLFASLVMALIAVIGWLYVY